MKNWTLHRKEGKHRAQREAHLHSWSWGLGGEVCPHLVTGRVTGQAGPWGSDAKLIGPLKVASPQSLSSSLSQEDRDRSTQKGEEKASLGMTPLHPHKSSIAPGHSTRDPVFTLFAVNRQRPVLGHTSKNSHFLSTR